MRNFFLLPKFLTFKYTSRRSQFLMNEFLKIGLAPSTQDHEFTGVHRVNPQSDFLNFDTDASLPILDALFIMIGTRFFGAIAFLILSSRAYNYFSVGTDLCC